MTPPALELAPATEAEFFAIPEPDRFHELLAGELVRKAAPSGRHGAAQLRVGRSLGPFDRRADDPDDPQGPGGWRFASEDGLELAVASLFDTP